MDSTSPTTFEYAIPSAVLKPVNLATAGFVRTTAIVSVSVGVLILVVYRLTAIQALPGLGLLWLGVGGLTTSFCVLFSIIQLLLIRSPAPNAGAGRRLYATALLVGLASYPIAFGCAAVGSTWMDGPHFRLRVYNDSIADIDSVLVHFDEGTVELGPVKAGTFKTSGLKWLMHSGPLWITVKAGSDERRIVDRIFNVVISPQQHHALSGPYFDVRVETRELPKSLLAATRPSTP